MAISIVMIPITTRNSTSTELTAALALLQTLAVSVALVLLFTVARRATQPAGE